MKKEILIYVAIVSALILGTIGVTWVIYQKSQSPIVEVYYFHGSSSVSDTYSWQEKEGILKYETFNTGNHETKEKKVNKDDMIQFLNQEKQISCDLQKEPQSEGGSYIEYYYINDKQEKICLQRNNSTDSFFQKYFS